MNHHVQQPPGQIQDDRTISDEFVSPIPDIPWEDWFDDAKRPDLIRHIMQEWPWINLATRFPFILYASDFSEDELTVVEYAERQVAAKNRDTINLLKRSVVGRMALLYVTQQIEVVPIDSASLAALDDSDLSTSEPRQQNAAD